MGRTVSRCHGIIPSSLHLVIPSEKRIECRGVMVPSLHPVIPSIVIIKQEIAIRDRNTNARP